MFTAALFIRARAWKYPKCSHIEKWIKTCHTDVLEYHSATKRARQCHLQRGRTQRLSSQVKRVRHRKTDAWYHFIWNLKKGTKELIYKPEVKSQMEKMNLVKSQMEKMNLVKSHRWRKWTYSSRGDRGMRDKPGDWDLWTLPYITLFVIILTLLYMICRG